MKLEDIHVGDVLRIRDWDDMLNEYGPDGFGGICTPKAFAKEMRYLCGKIITIKSINHLGEINSVEGFENSGYCENRRPFNWILGAKMLEPCESEDFILVDLSQFLS